MPRATEPPTAQREFVLQALKERLRTDGRTLLQGREAKLTFGQELGWVECSLGKTRVVAHVSGTIGKPRADRPFEGLFTIHSEISPMASPVYEAGRASDEEVVITRMLDKILRRSDALDREALCILAGQRVWHIKLTLHFLSDEGNLLDCACLAGVAAMRHFRRPEVEVVGEEVIIHNPNDRAPVPLSIHHTPICVTLAFFEDSESPLIDLNHLETSLQPSTVTIALTHLTSSTSPTLCVLHKAGGMPLSINEIKKCLDVAIQRAREMAEWVEAEIKTDWDGRRTVVEVR